MTRDEGTGNGLAAGTAQWPIEEAPAPTSVEGRTLSRKGERTRGALLEAAEQVFGALGYHEASIVKITEAAGVAQGTFYRYFSSKQAIFEELVVDLNRRVRHAMSEGAARGTTRAEAERHGFAAYLRFTAEHPALYRIIRQAEFVSPATLREHYEKIAAGYVEGLRRAMGEGEIVEADAEVLAYALMGAGELVGMRWVLWAEASEVPEVVVDELAAFVSRGLGARNGWE
ncbi:TetR/AcrR family transcriptional regulator [Egibacter rhizosphaerae]|uniref:TetR/AcrR family transcriptional regulator n=1 Tax=Egibacter rhizosphaerae TaxID=1670831 RepID=A0A411YHW6_9ACTN|nr:TetR/AcrR family transcriptional regulator [Egibacter rhizosphaerae]QBI20709.1 TetR/AcrR family transcriptional regulator [Egibacter rhizosphaerae]